MHTLKVFFFKYKVNRENTNYRNPKTKTIKEKLEVKTTRENPGGLAHTSTFETHLKPKAKKCYNKGFE